MHKLDNLEPERKLLRVITCDASEADQAFAVYSTLARLAVDDNILGRLPLMAELRALAYERFLAAFEVQ